MTPRMGAADWDSRYAGKQWRLDFRPTALIVELVSALRPGCVLELGAGEGRQAVWLAQQGWQVTAADFSKVGLERAHQRAQACGVQIQSVVVDVRDVEQIPGGFDLVLIAYMHPQPEDREAVFAAVAQAVAPGGHLLVLGLDFTDPNAHRDGETDDWRFTPDHLRDAFPGIALARCERVTRDVPTEHGIQQAVDTLAWGRRPV